MGIIAFNSYGQDDNAFRKPFKLTLAVDSLRFYEQEIEKSPYFVKDNILQIFPGEKIFVEVETKKNEIVSMKTVSENIHPKKTIEIEFRQKANGKISELMILRVNNPFKKKLSYEAMMYIVGHDKWIKTSILPVGPTISGVETWTDVIVTLVLSDWKLE